MYFTALAIFISCLGLLGLAAYMVEQRTKEIGIRKVLGASIPGIILLLSKEFARWVLLANVIAWPVAYFLARSWLDNFAYPTSEQGIDALVSKPADPNIKNWKAGGYLGRLPKDPWGNEYQYLNPGQNGEIDIYTFGRDGRPGGEGTDADIGNWELE